MVDKTKHTSISNELLLGILIGRESRPSFFSRLFGDLYITPLNLKSLDPPERDFVPVDNVKNRLWLDVDNVNIITKDNSNFVEQWDDKSGR